MSASDQRMTAPSQAQVLLHQAVLQLLRHMLSRVRQGKQSETGKAE